MFDLVGVGDVVEVGVQHLLGLLVESETDLAGQKETHGSGGQHAGTDDYDGLDLLDVLVVEFVEEEEEQSDYYEGKAHPHDEEDKLLVTLNPVLHVQGHSVLSSGRVSHLVVNLIE